MEVEFREARNAGQLRQLHRPVQIRTKMVDHPVNSLGIFALNLALRVGHGSTIVSHKHPAPPQAPLARPTHNSRKTLKQLSLEKVRLPCRNAPLPATIS